MSWAQGHFSGHKRQGSGSLLRAVTNLHYSAKKLLNEAMGKRHTIYPYPLLAGLLWMYAGTAAGGVGTGADMYRAHRQKMHFILDYRALIALK